MADLTVPALIAAITLSAPAVDLNAQSKDPITAMKNNPSLIIIAQRNAGSDPHGEDPHGKDPHDEVHDKGLPANQYKKEYNPPKDTYGRDVPNTNAPYSY